MELLTEKKPVFHKTTEYTIQKKLERWERATSRRARSEPQRSPSHGGGSDGDATASALCKQAQSKRWKQRVVPRFAAEEAVIIIKPKETLNVAQFRGSNQIGEAMSSRSDSSKFELGGQARAVQAYIETSDNISRGVIQVDPKATEADITLVIYSPEAPVVGLRKLRETNVAAITFEGRRCLSTFITGEKLCRFASTARRHQSVDAAARLDIGPMFALIRRPADARLVVREICKRTTSVNPAASFAGAFISRGPSSATKSIGEEVLELEPGGNPSMEKSISHINPRTL
ncbi:hypothetical protein HPB49_002825 [Dermacentor silvarum]|uniref:Uncharacterized protein n=1 Tax=Dermacentor silvarum TaxID=543639 RepID=A0ACB8CPG9_DERSI|nr:hypothetical protein HPB49_002825 [Dermacentor silvarum]